MLRLKGSMLDRLPPEKRAKMERTLQRMDTTRRKDDMRIRDIVEAKKAWAEQEKKKGLDIIDQLEKRKEELTKEQDKIRTQLITIDGCLLALNDVLNTAAKLEIEEDALKEAEAKRAAEEEARRIAEAEAARVKEEEAKKQEAELAAQKMIEKKPKKRTKKEKL